MDAKHTIVLAGRDCASRVTQRIEAGQAGNRLAVVLKVAQLCYSLPMIFATSSLIAQRCRLRRCRQPLRETLFVSKGWAGKNSLSHFQRSAHPAPILS
jgi:hypothetical protein